MRRRPFPSGPAARPRRRRTRRVEGVISRGARGVRDRRRGDRRASPRPRDPRASPVTRRSGTPATARARRGAAARRARGPSRAPPPPPPPARPVAKTRREEREERRERPSRAQGRRSRRRESTVGQQQRIRRYPRTIAHHVLAVRPACAPATARGRLGAARRRRAHETRAISPRVKHARVWIRQRAGTVQTAGETLVHHLRLYPMKRLRARRRRHLGARRRARAASGPPTPTSTPRRGRGEPQPLRRSRRRAGRSTPGAVVARPVRAAQSAPHHVPRAHASNTAAMGGGRVRLTSNHVESVGTRGAVRRSRRFAFDVGARRVVARRARGDPPTRASESPTPTPRFLSTSPPPRHASPRPDCTAATDPPPRV